MEVQIIHNIQNLFLNLHKGCSNLFQVHIHRRCGQCYLQIPQEAYSKDIWYCWVCKRLRLVHTAVNTCTLETFNYICSLSYGYTTITSISHWWKYTHKYCYQISCLLLGVMCTCSPEAICHGGCSCIANVDILGVGDPQDGRGLVSVEEAG